MEQVAALVAQRELPSPIEDSVEAASHQAELSDTPESEPVFSERELVLEQFADTPMAYTVNGTTHKVSGSFEAVMLCQFLQNEKIPAAFLSVKFNEAAAFYAELEEEPEEDLVLEEESDSSDIDEPKKNKMSTESSTDTIKEVVSQSKESKEPATNKSELSELSTTPPVREKAQKEVPAAPPEENNELAQLAMNPVEQPVEIIVEQDKAEIEVATLPLFEEPADTPLPISEAPGTPVETPEETTEAPEQETRPLFEALDEQPLEVAPTESDKEEVSLPAEASALDSEAKLPKVDTVLDALEAEMPLKADKETTSSSEFWETDSLSPEEQADVTPVIELLDYLAEAQVAQESEQHAETATEQEENLEALFLCLTGQIEAALHPTVDTQPITETDIRQTLTRILETAGHEQPEVKAQLFLERYKIHKIEERLRAIQAPDHTQNTFRTQYSKIARFVTRLFVRHEQPASSVA